MTDRFHFARPNPVSGRRGIDYTVRMHIRIACIAAQREAAFEGRAFCLLEAVEA